MKNVNQYYLIGILAAERISGHLLTSKFSDIEGGIKMKKVKIVLSVLCLILGLFFVFDISNAFADSSPPIGLRENYYQNQPGPPSHWNTYENRQFIPFDSHQNVHITEVRNEQVSSMESDSITAEGYSSSHQPGPPSHWNTYASPQSVITNESHTLQPVSISTGTSAYFSFGN